MTTLRLDLSEVSGNGLRIITPEMKKWRSWFADQQVLTVRCMHCGWEHTDRLADARPLFRQHRAEAHGR